jgi:hypothetical protein
MINDRNHLFNMRANADEENSQLREQLRQAQDQVIELERSISRPIRQNRIASWTQEELNEVERSMRNCGLGSQTCEENSWINNHLDEPYEEILMDIDNTLLYNNTDNICLQSEVRDENHVMTDEEMVGLYREGFVERGM